MCGRAGGRECGGRKGFVLRSEGEDEVGVVRGGGDAYDERERVGLETIKVKSGDYTEEGR